jgi:hypothetical protein
MAKKKLYGWNLWCEHNLKGSIKEGFVLDFLAGDLNHINESESVEIIKTSKSSRIVRLCFNQKSVILKIFRRHKFKDKLRRRPTGLTEYQNLIEAAKRNVRTPECYLYFEKRYWGILKYSGIVMEDMRNYTEFEKLYASGQCTYFDVIPLLKELYMRGVNHIDFSPRNIFFNRYDKSFAVIDWQYSSFYPMANPISFCLMAATFLHYIGVRKGMGVWKQWLDALRAECKPDISADNLYNAVEIMQNRKLHWKSRLSLDIGGLGLESIHWEKC